MKSFVMKRLMPRYALFLASHVQRFPRPASEGKQVAAQNFWSRCARRARSAEIATCRSDAKLLVMAFIRESRSIIMKNADSANVFVIRNTTVVWLEREV